MPEQPWAKRTETVITGCEVDPARGLSEAEARRRAAVHGPNRLHRREPVKAWIVLIKQFKSLIVGILAAAAILAFAFGEMLESLAVLVVIILNTAIGFVTELRAVRSMEALYALGTVTTRVRREGRVIEVRAEQLVPGDIVVLEGGDVVTADLRVVECSKLQADESALTGESLPIRKQSDPLDPDTLLAERSNMLFKGTAVTRGSGVGVVVHTGMATQLGLISDLVATAGKSASPLEQRLDRLAHRLIWLTLIVGALVAALVLCTLLLLIAVYVRPLGSALDIHRPNLQGWFLILSMSLIPLVFGQIMKGVASALDSARSRSRRVVKAAA